ncbi:hypothetical protein BD410DRAFT_388666 [Rickenella mellea]|uniref:Uncharacterized protein n=1 Tax=Rickenella mellea TaxID=50990 RepID=A0A4Y7PZF6_9AGAM|nr:hypothetical protein BD410DRAFT_388666 [Rickenella mellea]
MGVFCLENCYYTTSNTDKMHPIPAQLPEDPEIGDLLRDCQTPQWSSPIYPSLPFILKRPRWQGPLLRRLAQNHEVFPITHGPLGCILQSFYRTRGNDWRSCFNAIALFPESPPSVNLTDEAGNYGSLWFQILLENGVSSTWAMELQNSQIADFSGRTERVGPFIDPNECPAPTRCLSMLLRCDIPIWTYMGNGQPSFANNIVGDRFRISRGQFLAAIAWPAPAPLPAPPSSAPSILPSTSYPQPQAGSGQKIGET